VSADLVVITFLIGIAEAADDARRHAGYERPQEEVMVLGPMPVTWNAFSTEVAGLPGVVTYLDFHGSG